MPKERIAKRIAAAGLCSRREAELWIEQERVLVNGEVVHSPATTVTAQDVIKVDGQALPAKPTPQLWLYHKPVGLVTTHKDPQGRPTVFDKLPAQLPRVISVGRLDVNSEGLLLLTNDGELARSLELPSNGWKRTYRVRVLGTPSHATLAQWQHGMTIDGIRYAPAEVAIDKTGDTHKESKHSRNCWLTMTLTEGKNREIRKLCEHFGHRVSRLMRVSYGPFQLGNLQRGAVKEVLGKQLRDACEETTSMHLPQSLDTKTHTEAQAASPRPKKPKGWAKAKPKKPRHTRSTRNSDK